MDFFSEYYLWFLIGGIILVMALIGFIADKTDFGRKDITKKQEDGKEKTKKANEEKKENIVIEEQNDSSINNIEEVVSNSEIIVEDVKPGNDESIIEKTDLEEMQNSEVDTMNEVNDFEVSVVEEDELPTVEPTILSDMDEVIETQDTVEEISVENNDQNKDVSNDDIEIKEDEETSAFDFSDDLSIFAAVEPIGSVDSIEDNKTSSNETEETISEEVVNESVEEIEEEQAMAIEADEDIWKF